MAFRGLLSTSRCSMLRPVRCLNYVRINSSRYILKSKYPYIDRKVPLHHFLWKNISKWPHRTAIECSISGKKYSYMNLYEKCLRLSWSLNHLGIKRRDNIGVYLPNIPEYPIAFIGTLQLDLIVNTINSRYSKEELSYQIKNSNINWIICHPTNVKTVLEARKYLNRDIKIICTHDVDGSNPARLEEKVIHFEELISDSIQLSDSHLVRDIDLSDTSVIFYSSGTTGLPKGVCLNHKALIASQQQWTNPPNDKLIEAHGDHQDIIPAVLPFFHIYGNTGVLLASLQYGAKILTIPRFQPESFINIFANNRNLVLFIAPPLLFYLGNSDSVKPKHLKHVREIITGGAPASQSDLDKVFAKINGKVSDCFGMTEMSGAITTKQINRHDNQSDFDGLVAGTSCKIVNLATGESLPPNTPGEICFKGPNMMKGYLNNPMATAETIDADGWLHSGDIGYYDNDGQLNITDRLKDLIKVSGFQVAPAELEEVLRRCPGVMEAGVVGAPNEKTGEVPVAFVKTTLNSRISEHQVKQFLASHLSKYKHLSAVHFVDNLPKTPSGKIIKAELKKMI